MTDAHEKTAWDCWWKFGDVYIPKTPEVGMLVGLDDEWLVVHSDGYLYSDVYMTTIDPDPDEELEDHLKRTPLLPSPATLQAHGLTAFDAAYQTFDLVDTSDDRHSTAGVICHRMEHMTLWWCGHDDKPHMLCKPITADNHKAAQRDLSKCTQLFAWLDTQETTCRSK